MRREIFRITLGLIAGLIAGFLVMLLFKSGDINSMNFDDIVPLIGIFPFFIYDSYKRIKQLKQKEHQMYVSFTNNKIFSYDNLLITPNYENKLVSVRNDLFWNDNKPMDAAYDELLFNSLIKDFTQFLKSYKSIAELMNDMTIEFTLVDNINFEDKILLQKKVEYSLLK